MKQTILYLLLGIFLLTSCQQEEIPNTQCRNCNGNIEFGWHKRTGGK